MEKKIHRWACKTYKAPQSAPSMRTATSSKDLSYSTRNKLAINAIKSCNSTDITKERHFL